MRAAFYQVLEMSATASVVILIVLALRFCLRRAPKVYSYALWSVVLFRLLCPFSIESGLSILPRQTAATQTEIAQYEAIEAGEEYLAAYHAMGDALNGGLDYIDVKLEPKYVQTLEEEEQQDTIALSHGEVWKLLLSSLWPVGAMLLLGRSLISVWRLRRSLRGAMRLRENIYLSESIQTPFTMGLFRPAVYLPEGLGEHEQEYIICHERYHIRRFDHVTKVLAFLALCVHWFNPLVWLAFHLAGKDMEMSCDEAVVKQLGSGIRADYSQSLLTLATGRRMAVGTHLAFGDGDTKSRIQNVLNWKKPKVWVSVLAVVVCVIAAAVCITDPVQPVDTQQVERAYTQILSLPEDSLTIKNEDEANVTEKLILGEERESLLALLNRYAAERRVTLPDWKPRASYQENAARLEMADGTYFELRSWYTNGYSFHPAHFGEDEYDTTLARYDSGGMLISCWKMEYDFDRPFREWLLKQARAGLGTPVDELVKPGIVADETTEYDPHRRVWNFEDLKPGQTFYFTENIVRGGGESTFVIQTTYAPSELTLELGLIRDDGHADIHTVERGGLHGTSIFKNKRVEEYAIFIRNVSEEDGEAASGSIIIELSSEQDYFQRSTPFVPATVFDKAERVMVRSNIDVPDVSKAELIALLNEEAENFQDTHIPADFALQPESAAEVRIMCVDGSWYLLEGWYDETSANGYRTTLTWKDSNFHVIGTWMMDDDFNRSYHEWLDVCHTRMTLADSQEENLTGHGQMLAQHPDHLSVASELYQAILDHHRSNKSDQHYCCADFVVLANEEGTRHDPVTGGNLRTKNYFLWVLYQEYLFTEAGIVHKGGAHIPTNITLEENADGSWTVLNYWEPRDGSYYVEDIKAIFPGDSANDALDSQKYVLKQTQNCYAQALAYAKTDSDVKMDVDKVIEGLLDVVCSSPMTSSNPKDYAAEHFVEYRELKFYGDYTREYCARQLLDENRQMGLRERIMEMLLGELNL